MNKYVHCLLLLFMIGLISGCEKQNVVDVTLSKTDEALTFWTSYSKRFNKYDYTLENEKEATNDIKEKLAVQTSPFFDSARDLIKNEMKTDKVTQNPEKFIIQSSVFQANIISQIEFADKQGNYLSYGTVSQEFVYLEDLQKVKLKEQQVEIYNATIDDTFQGKNLDNVLSELAKQLNLENSDEIVENFHQESSDKESLSQKTIVLYNDLAESDEAQTLGKLLCVEYNSIGRLYRIYALLRDNRLDVK